MANIMANIEPNIAKTKTKTQNKNWPSIRTIYSRYTDIIGPLLVWPMYDLYMVYCQALRQAYRFVINKNCDFEFAVPNISTSWKVSNHKPELNIVYLILLRGSYAPSALS